MSELGIVRTFLSPINKIGLVAHCKTTYKNMVFTKMVRSKVRSVSMETYQCKMKPYQIPSLSASFKVIVLMVSELASFQ